MEDEFKLTTVHKNIIKKMTPDYELVVKGNDSDVTFWADWNNCHEDKNRNSIPKKIYLNKNAKDAVWDFFEKGILEPNLDLKEEYGYTLQWNWKKIQEFGLTQYFDVE